MPEGSRCQSQSISSIVSFSQRVPCRWIPLFRATIGQYRNQRFLARRQETFEIEWRHRGKKIDSYRSDVLFLFPSIDLPSIIFIVKKRSARSTEDLCPIRQQERNFVSSISYADTASLFVLYRFQQCIWLSFRGRTVQSTRKNRRCNRGDMPSFFSSMDSLKNFDSRYSL